MSKPTISIAEIQADVLRMFAADAERTFWGIERPGSEASEDYWRGGTDATNYLLARLRAHADFLIHGHATEAGEGYVPLPPETVARRREENSRIVRDAADRSG